MRTIQNDTALYSNDTMTFSLDVFYLAACDTFAGLALELAKFVGVGNDVNRLRL